MSEASLAGKIFRQNDGDRNGVLDERELRKVVRDLAKATGVYLSAEQVNAEVQKCLKKFGEERGVTQEGFERFAASEPAAFRALIMWREVFSKYASREDEIQEADTLKLVQDVCAANQHAITRARAVSEAKELMQAANFSGKASINFGEFVAYARKRPALFGKLAQQVMHGLGPAGGARKRGSSQAREAAAVQSVGCAPVSTPESLPRKLGLTEERVFAALSSVPAEARCVFLALPAGC